MRVLTSKVNVNAADGQYPYGRVRNNPGDHTGTPVDEALVGDIIQFFERLFSQSGLVANNLPDNNYTGFQLYNAFQFYVQRHGLALFLDGIGNPPAGVVTGKSYYFDTSTGNLWLAQDSPYSQVMAGMLSPTAWVEIGSGGGAPAFQNSWGNLSIATPARYRKTNSGLVTLDGVIEGDVAGDTAFTLPLGFRPQKQTVLPATIQTVSPIAGTVEILTNGEVKPSWAGGGTAVLVTLNGHFYNS